MSVLIVKQKKDMSVDMILPLLLLTMLLDIAVADDYPDFYALKRNGLDTGYKVFTRVGDCTVYVSGDHRVLFHDGEGWKIANHFGYFDRDCQNILNSVKIVYVLTGGLALNGKSHFTIQRQSFDRTSSIDIRSLQRCKEIQGLKLFGGTISQYKKYCQKDYWGKHFPNRNIFTSFSYSYSLKKWQCNYEVDELVTLVEGSYATLFIHSSCVQQTEPDHQHQQENNRNHPPTVSSTPTTTETKPEPSTTSASIFSESESVESGKSRKSTTIINVLIGAGIAIVLIVGVLVGFFIRRQEKTKEILEENEIYGRHEPGKYYEDENQAESEVKDENDYYLQ